MTKRNPDDPEPTWFRLSPQTWALIRDQYVSGVTARVLAKKYRTSPTSIYRRASQEGWTKQASGQAMGRAPQPLPIDAEAMREAEASAWVEEIAASEDALDIAGALERRALAQAGAALVRGRAGEAKALASLAEQMRKRGAATQAQAQSQTLAPQIGEEDRADYVADMFAKIAYVAAAMVHAPSTAPTAFEDLIRQWRQTNLGEGEVNAQAKAAKIAAAQARYLNGDWMADMPDQVRARLESEWARQVARMQSDLAEG